LGLISYFFYFCGFATIMLNLVEKRGKQPM
jgi:hypothetical protein